MKYLFTLLLLSLTLSLPAQRSKLLKGIAYYEAKDYKSAFKKLTPVMKRLHRLDPAEQAAAVYYYNLVKINIFKRMYRMGLSDKLYNFLLEGYKGFEQVDKYDRNGRWEDKVLLYRTMYYPFVMESAENLLIEAESDRGLSEAKRMQNYRDAEAFIRLSLDVKESSAAYVLLGQVELGKDNPQEAYRYFSRALNFYRKDRPSSVDFSIGKAIYYRALIEKASNLTSEAVKTLRWGRVFMENEHLRFNASRETRAPVIQVKAEAEYLGLQGDLLDLETKYLENTPGILDRTLQLFEKEVDQYPNSYLSLIAYGSLLEESNAEKALKLYERAARASADDVLALKKIGLLLLEKAKSYAPARQGQTVTMVRGELQRDEAVLLERIYPYLKKVIASDPESGEVIEGLLYIADRLDLREDYRNYRAMRDKLNR